MQRDTRRRACGLSNRAWWGVARARRRPDQSGRRSRITLALSSSPVTHSPMPASTSSWEPLTCRRRM